MNTPPDGMGSGVRSGRARGVCVSLCIPACLPACLSRVWGDEATLRNRLKPRRELRMIQWCPLNPITDEGADAACTLATGVGYTVNRSVGKLRGDGRPRQLQAAGPWFDVVFGVVMEMLGRSRWGCSELESWLSPLCATRLLIKTNRQLGRRV